MTTVSTLADLIESLAPSHLAEEWDNVGLLVGDRSQPVRRIMTCLTITPEAAAEAIREQADLIVVHHPLPFRPLKRLTTDSPSGKILWDLAGAKISLLSPHTAFDSAAQGINQQLAEGLALSKIAPLLASDLDPTLGSGRLGEIEKTCSLETLAAQVKKFLNIETVRVVGTEGTLLSRVAVACGSGGSFLEAAQQAGCDCLVTGEATFHTCLEAQAQQISMILTGHFASERFAVERLAKTLSDELPSVHVWPSLQESDPLRNF